MAKLSRVVGTTSLVTEVVVLDNTSTVGNGKTGIAYNASGLTCYYKRSNGSASVACTINTISTLGTYAGSATNAAWGEVDSTNMPGVYELQIPNNALASGADSVVLVVRGAAGMVDVRLEIELTATNNQDGVHGGMTAIPNAVAGALNGLFISGANTGPVSIAGGLSITGTAAVTSTPATAALTLTGGAASITGGGVAGVGLNVVGGAGAASTNGAAIGATITGGGTNTVSSAAHGVSLTGTSTGAGLNSLIDTVYTLFNYIEIIGAATAGASSGGPGSPAFKSLDAAKTPVSGTADASGNRSAISYSP